MPLTWEEKLQTLLFPEANENDYLKANTESVGQVIRGLGPDDKDPKPGAGAKVVFNMSCTHIPDFCENGYKNAYDLNKNSLKREFVDGAIENATDENLKKETIYFGAVETSGTGIRFYGDMCLVLSHQPTDETYVLDRNSYDVIREPICSKLETESRENNTTIEDLAGDQLKQWLGKWGSDLTTMAAIKVSSILPIAHRRWTTGQIAEAILIDEDYLEVLYPKCLEKKDLLEVRVSAADVAAESDIANRDARGQAPTLHELEWWQQRNKARQVLAESGIPVRVITTSGRIKG